VTRPPLGRYVFAAGVMSLGVLDLIYRDTLMWKVLPPGVPAQAVLAGVTGVLLILAGLGLFSSKFAEVAARVLLVFLVPWDLLIGVPPVVTSPSLEVNWLIFGMMTIVAVAAWLLTGSGQLRVARTIVGLALVPVGLSHFFYLQVTLNLVPIWMPARMLWLYLAGIGHIAAGLGLLLGVFPRLAARLEAYMLMSFAILVWIPRVITSSGVHFNWTELLGTGVISGAVWVMADALAGPEAS
jgi:uncharacterized membrane protein